MAQTQPSTLEDRIAALESGYRALMASNWTDRASVVDASGNAVQLSSLAFGQVADLWSGVGVMNVSGVNGQASGASSNPASWTYPGHPSVTVLVRGGRLRVDWSALMALNGGNPAAPYVASWAYSYRVVYLGPEGAQGSVSQQIINPDYYRAIMVRDTSTAGNGMYQEVGNWAMHTGLTPGWYRVDGAWLLGYANSASGSTPQGFTDNPRIAATPY